MLTAQLPATAESASDTDEAANQKDDGSSRLGMHASMRYCIITCNTCKMLHMQLIVVRARWHTDCQCAAQAMGKGCRHDIGSHMFELHKCHVDHSQPASKDTGR